MGNIHHPAGCPSHPRSKGCRLEAAQNPMIIPELIELVPVQQKLYADCFILIYLVAVAN